MKYHFRFLAVGFLILVLSTIVSAQDNGNGNRGRNNDPGVLPNGNLDPTYVRQFPSEDSTVVHFGNSGQISIATPSCEAVTLNRLTFLWENSGLRNTAISRVRSYEDANYPCDISRVGARSRLWVAGFNVGDSTMLYAYNAADKQADVRATGYTCSDINKLGRGNFEFRQGTSNFTYQLEDDAC